MESPRHIKTHLPFELLPEDLLDKCKVVYVARNPLDVCVSYYHHNRLARLHDYTGDFPTYWDLFKNDEVVYAPYWAHVESGYSRRNNPNLLFLFYEELKRDLPSQIRKVASFLNKTINDDEVEKLANFLHIDNFKKNSPHIPIKGIANENRGSFIRKGEIGGNSEFTEDLAKEAREWFKENIERNTMVFPEF
nr:sulfotransferase family cytosolic 1B member 1 [Halyomorpha halys]